MTAVASVPTADPATGQDKGSAPNVSYLMMLLTLRTQRSRILTDMDPVSPSAVGHPQVSGYDCE